jgi:hypothetical protein
VYNETPYEGVTMTNEKYFKNIYRIKFAIDALEEAFYSQETVSDEDIVKYEDDRAALVKELEAAYAAD